MKNKIENFVGKYIMLPIFGLERSVRIYFYIKTGLKINLEHPTYYCEKIQIRKLYPKKIYTLCADKYLVRDYVKEKLKDMKEDILIPQYFAKEKISLEDLETLPNRFILKTNNGSKTNIIVHDKEKENLKKIVKKMNKYVKKKFGYNTFELFYNDIPPLIIAEQYIGTENEVPDDYKFFCFRQKNGEFIIRIMMDHGRFTDHQYRAFYDENWNVMPYGNESKEKGYGFKKPKDLSKMLEIAKKLAEDFDFVRVDLYYVKNKIYFGELTFTDGSGYEPLEPFEYEKIWGAYWIQDNKEKSDNK